MKHNYAIDCGRLLAAFGVILIHLGPSTPQAEYLTEFFLISSVPFFIITSLYLFQAKEASFDNIRYARIIIPYISWSVIYLLARQVKSLISGTPLTHDWVGVLFFGDAGMHLYFLPLILCFQLLAAVGFRLLSRKEKQTSRKVFALLLAIALLILIYLPRDRVYTGFGDRFLLRGALYILLAGMLINWLPNLMGQHRRVSLFSLSALIGLLFVGIGTSYIYRDFVSALIATLILIICLVKPIYTVSKDARLVLSSTYGIFLSHPLFVESTEVLMHKLSIDFLPYSVLFKLTYAAFIMGICILFVLLVRRWSTLSFLLLGEAPKKSSPQ
jgi:surface polysaccharide O-acyltransferase-like enzyme